MRTKKNEATIKKNHMDVLWHEYTDKKDLTPITGASLSEKASVIGRVGIMMLACGTGAWRVRSSMNELSELMNVTCTVDIGLMSINYTCFDGNDSFSQSLCLTNTGVNTSQLNRLEKLVSNFATDEIGQSCEKIQFKTWIKLKKFQWPLFSCYVSCIRSIGLWRIYFPSWRRNCRNAMCICRCRNRKLYQV